MGKNLDLKIDNETADNHVKRGKLKAAVSIGFCKWSGPSKQKQVGPWFNMQFQKELPATFF